MVDRESARSQIGFTFRADLWIGRHFAGGCDMNHCHVPEGPVSGWTLTGLSCFGGWVASGHARTTALTDEFVVEDAELGFESGRGLRLRRTKRHGDAMWRTRPTLVVADLPRELPVLDAVEQGDPHAVDKLSPRAVIECADVPREETQ